MFATQPHRSLRHALTFVVLVAVATVASAANAHEPARPEAASDASGTWTWTTNGGRTRMTLRLMQNGEGLIGAISADNGPEKAIQEGKVDGNKILFKVGTMMGKVRVVAVYQGTVDANTIKGGTKVYVGPKPTEPKRPIPWRAQRAD
jgi:hypothetical protein